MNDTCPCKDCVDDRHIGCHAVCERYLEWKKKHDEKVAQERIARGAQYSERTGRWYQTPNGHWRNSKLPRRRKR